MGRDNNVETTVWRQRCGDNAGRAHCRVVSNAPVKRAPAGEQQVTTAIGSLMNCQQETAVGRCLARHASSPLQAGRQAGRQAGGQAGGQAGRQAESHPPAGLRRHARQRRSQTHRWRRSKDQPEREGEEEEAER